MTHRNTERHLGAAAAGWDLHDMRHSRLTHAGEDGTTEADLMNLSGHENRRTLQRYLKPSKGHPPTPRRDRRPPRHLDTQRRGLAARLARRRVL
jgi:integrase/recombinase XerC